MVRDLGGFLDPPDSILGGEARGRSPISDGYILITVFNRRRSVPRTLTCALCFPAPFAEGQRNSRTLDLTSRHRHVPIAITTHRSMPIPTAAPRGQNAARSSRSLGHDQGESIRGVLPRFLALANLTVSSIFRSKPRGSLKRKIATTTAALFLLFRFGLFSGPIAPKFEVKIS